MTERVRLGTLEDLPDRSGVRVEAFGHRVAVFRVGTEVYAIGDRCSHAEASLSEGELWDMDVECPRHGSEFNIATGEPDSLPATKPVPVYQVAVTTDGVFLDLEPREDD